MFENFEKSFYSFELKTKIQLFILPLLIIYFIYYFHDLYKVEDKKIDFAPKVEKKFSESYLELFRKIEDLAILNKLEIINLGKEKELVKISLKGSLSKISKFLFDIENLNNFTNISRIKYEVVQNSAIYELDIRLDKYYAKNLKQIEYKKENENLYKLRAIIGNFVVINEKMYRLGENIDKYKLSKITKNYVLLENGLSQIKLEIKNEKFTKYIN